MGRTYLHAVASVDGYIADEHDGVGPLHDWYFNGDHPLVDDHADVHGGAPFRVSAASVDYVRGMWSRQKVVVMGRHLFDPTNGWEGHPPAAAHVVVVSHRPKPEGWHPEASYHFATSVEEGMARAQELAGEGGDYKPLSKVAERGRGSRCPSRSRSSGVGATVTLAARTRAAPWPWRLRRLHSSIRPPAGA